ncbi:TlpA disulfide reductase family protein [Hazenella coriacea]|uniref:Peroxiredoxin n=1 Tax=Hazenella coriacea TaxID=1179467 RepID=A0A4R3LCM5_9BACL|nr:TlpA disulfide reductase family protein [Hazenella coriacea]TCS97040.1 peroxiredoxin [Hazenella coriacea]
MLPTAPRFELQDLHGKNYSLKSMLGKIIWLEFWVTWCPACQQTLPRKNLLYRSYNHPSLCFLTINVTGREAEPERVQTFAQQMGYQFPILKDQGCETYDAYGITSVPASVLINQQGEIHGIYDETTPITDIIQQVGKLLSSV